MVRCLSLHKAAYKANPVKKVEWPLTLPSGPIVRITPTMLEVSRSSALPIIFNRYADKAKTYITGAFGDEPDSSFNSRHWRDHAQIRRFLNGAVGDKTRYAGSRA